MFDMQSMPRGDHVNIKMTFNRNQNIPTGFLGAKDELPVFKEFFVMK
jgi:hypothetical protein